MHRFGRLLNIRRQIALASMVAILASTTLFADPPVKDSPKKPASQLPVGAMDAKVWLKASTKPLSKGEIDRLINAELAKVNIKPAGVTTDEQFIRRVYLDLTGRLPTPADIVAFSKDTSTDKRAKLIDKLLDSSEYARHWGQYWRNVVTSRAELNFQSLPLVPHFEKWLVEQFKANKGWDSITKDILTSSGKMLNAEQDKNGQAFFLISRRGADAVTEIAAETSRIFLGIQIQCAQCHDHPSDVWKRQNFHEFAAFFTRYRSIPIREEMRFIGTEIRAIPFGEHGMPDKDDPKKKKSMSPRFLDGKSPGKATGPVIVNGPKGGFPKGGFGKGGFGGFGGLSDEVRRKALAEYVVSKDNPWFAAAFVNRTWGEFMGQSFYMPIDDIGPQKDAMMPDVIARVAGAFRGNGYDIKQLFRDIMNSDTYQRQIRPGETGDEHLLFATRNPVRMDSNALWQSLTNTLGPISQNRFGFIKGGAGGGPFARFGGLEQQFKREFAFDPSSRPEEIEGSVSQALILMNNLQIQQKVRASGTNMLGQVLATYSQNDEAVRAVYLKTLSRRPTDRELTRCREFIANVGDRNEAFEDILWALINSTEFQMRR